MRSKKKTKHDAFAFASIGLAAASGCLSMSAFAAYLDALRPKAAPRKAKKGKR